MSFRRAMLVTASITLLGCSAYAAQQQNQPSVAEAARKNREEKKNQPQPTKVYNNDNIGGAGGPVSVVGQAPSSDTDSTGAPPAAGSGAHDKSYWHGKFSDARKKLADDKKDLDLLQREYNLKQTQYYSDPNEAMKQQYSSDDLKAAKDKIDQRTADVAKDEQAIEDLEDQLRQSGGDPGWARDDDQSSSDQTSPASEPPANSEGSQPSPSQPPAAQDHGSQPPAQSSSPDQGSQPDQRPSQAPPPSPQP